VGQNLGQPDSQWDDFADTLDYDDWTAVKEACDKAGILFFASVFDTEGVDWCEQAGVPLYKTASADITYRQLLEAVAETGKPIVMSTGGATPEDIGRALEWVSNISPQSNVLPLICTLSYPTPIKAARLRRLQTWQNVLGKAVGYSDHTASTCTPLVASKLGAVLVEKHFTIRPGEGGDHDFACTPDEAAFIVDNMHKTLSTDFCTLEEGTVLLKGDAEIKPYPEEEQAIEQARRSCVLVVDKRAGERIGADDVRFLRPGTGIPPYRVDEVIGRRLVGSVSAGQVLTELLLA
jgi:sialic acid synthase SpsE